MSKETGVLGFYETDADGNRIHRLTSELLRGVYHPAWRNNLRRLGFELRRKLQRKDLNYTCDCCGGRLYLAGKHYDNDEERPFGEQRLHLRHCSESEQKSNCVYRREQHKSLKDIDKDVHINKRESPEHFMLKSFIKGAIEKTFPECSVVVEQWIPVSNTRRRPDLNIVFERDGFLTRGTEIAIEVQVSQIMMHQIDRRMEIDGQGEKFTLWILDSYETQESGLNKIYKEDIFEAGGLNAFVVDAEAIHKTEETGIFHIHVWYDTYHIANQVLQKAVTKDEIIPFSDLTFERENDNYNVYYYPSLKERNECLQKIQEEQQRKEEEEAREKERLRRARLLENFLQMIDCPTYWPVDINEIIEMAKKDNSIYYEVVKRIRAWAYMKGHNWNQLVSFILLLKTAPRAMMIEWGDVFKLILNYIPHSPALGATMQFSMGELADIFPELTSYNVRFVTNPNYIVKDEDVSIATRHIKKIHLERTKGDVDRTTLDSFCYWTALIFADRIAKSDCSKEELLCLMGEKWNAVCVFLSMQVGFIVGSGFKVWVDFADYIKKNYPEYVGLFLDIAHKKHYSLVSKKRNQEVILRVFMRNDSFQRDEMAEKLIQIILPSLFK